MSDVISEGTATSAPTRRSAKRPDAYRPPDPVAPRHLRRTLVTGDVVAALLAWTLPALLLGSRVDAIISNPTLASVSGALIVISSAVALTVVLLATERLYLSRVCSMRTVEIARIGRASIVVGLAALVVAKFTGEEHLARVPIAKGIALFFFVNTWRAIYSSWLTHARRADRYTRSLLLIGADDEAFSLQEHLKRHPELGYRIAGVVGTRQTYEEHAFDAPWLGQTPFLPNILAETDIKGAIVAGGSMSRPQLNVAVRELLRNQVHIHMSTGVAGIDHRRMVSHSLAYEPMVYVEQSDLEGWQLGIKRVIDVGTALVLLILSAPIILLAGLAMKVSDGGPMLFRQKRVGRHSESFEILKLRTMCVDAEDKVVELRAGNVRQGPLFKLASDPRVTGFGRFLRATSIDELPQLWNVLRGHMSLVGPRPALPSEVEQFDEVLLARHNVRPGITGLWQVEGRDNPDFTLYQRLDLFYVENWTVLLDLAILIGTAKVVVVRSVNHLLPSTCRKRPDAHRTGAHSALN